MLALVEKNRGFKWEKLGVLTNATMLWRNRIIPPHPVLFPNNQIFIASSDPFVGPTEFTLCTSENVKSEGVQKKAFV